MTSEGDESLETLTKRQVYVILQNVVNRGIKGLDIRTNAKRSNPIKHKMRLPKDACGTCMSNVEVMASLEGVASS